MHDASGYRTIYNFFINTYVVRYIYDLFTAWSYDPLYIMPIPAVVLAQDDTAPELNTGEGWLQIQTLQHKTHLVRSNSLLQTNPEVKN